MHHCVSTYLVIRQSQEVCLVGISLYPWCICMVSCRRGSPLLLQLLLLLPSCGSQPRMARYLSRSNRDGCREGEKQDRFPVSASDASSIPSQNTCPKKRRKQNKSIHEDLRTALNYTMLHYRRLCRVPKSMPRLCGRPRTQTLRFRPAAAAGVYPKPGVHPTVCMA